MHIQSVSKLQSKGFTIVELLIVIVVIAILAAITIVAFNGVSSKAQVSKASSAVVSFQKLLEMHKSDIGGYPNPGGSTPYVCVGQVTNYPAVSGFAAGECANTGMSVSSQLNTALSKYSSSLPDGSLPYQLWYSGTPADGGVRGVLYRYYGPTQYQIIYKLPGTQQCPRSTSTDYDTTNGKTFTNCTIDSWL